MKLKSPISTDKANAALTHASKVCIKENLRGIIQKLFTIRKDINEVKEKLKEVIEKEKYESLLQVAQKRKETTYEKTKEKQIKKLNKLMIAKTPNDRQVTKANWIVNLSDRKLTEAEEIVLMKGMNFNISNKRLKPEDIIPVIETALEGYDKQKAELVRAQCALTLKKQKAEKPNITKEELKALQDIKADKSTVITQTDKGNTTVLLNKTTYSEKMNEHLQSGPYTIMTKSAETIINKTMKETANIVRQMKEVIEKRNMNRFVRIG
uniref:Uncharacterized protein n=1 Tax=Trichobilharzia regenti TaxID=157069 RepID=A0AA85K717_TRIRE|nr:unnamed protein product [Trichobilharzia regenti]